MTKTKQKRKCIILREKQNEKTNLIPCDQISLFNFESIRTSDVFIIFSANFFNSFTARGARFLKALF